MPGIPIGLSELAQLSAADLESLAKLIEVERDNRQRKSVRGCDDRAWYEAFEHVLSDRGIRMLSLPMWQRSASHKAYASNRKQLDELVDEFCKGHSWAAKAAARILIARCVEQWVAHHQVPLSVGSFCKHLANVTAAVNLQFPGYRRSGVLHLCLGLTSKKL